MQTRKRNIEPHEIGLSEIDLERISSVFSGFHAVDKVWLYGSRAKGNFKPYSDIDITLGGDELDLKIQHQIEWELDDLYLPYTFDVSILSAIDNQDLLEHIQRVGILIYEK